MSLNLNSPHRSESFAGDDLGENLVVGSFETSEYYASKGLVTPWQRNKRITLMDASRIDDYIPAIGSWKDDVLD